MTVRLTCFSEAGDGRVEFHRYTRDDYGLNHTHQGVTDDPAEISAMCQQVFPSYVLPPKFNIVANSAKLAALHKRYYG